MTLLLGFLILSIAALVSGAGDNVPVVYIMDKANQTFKVINNRELANPIFSPPISSSSCMSPSLALLDSSKANLTFYFENYKSTELKMEIEGYNTKELTPKLSFNKLTLEQEIQSTDLELNCVETGDQGWTYLTLSFSLTNSTSSSIIKASFLKICAPEKISKFDPAFLILLVGAIGIVGFGARMKYYAFESTEETEASELKGIHAIMFLLVGSLSLLFIFFFTSLAVIFLNLLFSVIAFTAISVLWEDVLDRVFGWKCKDKFNVGPIKGVSISSLISSIFALAIIAAYLATRSWILTDLIASQIAFFMLKLIRLPSLRIAYFFLGIAFAYDIFWVFISTPIFGSSVMAYAATKIDLPMKLEIPLLFSAFPLKRCSLIGLGDLVLPGIFVSFCHKFDIYKRRSIYFKTAFGGYILGLVLCYISLTFFQAAQPALLYLSPLTLLPVTFVAWRNNHLTEMMDGMTPKGLGSQEYSHQQIDGSLNLTNEMHADDSIEKGEFEG